MKKKLGLSILLMSLLVSSVSFAQGSSESTSQPEAAKPVTIEFMQWWEPEMTEGSLAKIVSEFEATHPNIKIKLISKPYSDVESQVTIAAATGTMSDVVGLNPKWAYNLASQGSLLSFNQFFGKDDFDQSKIDVTKVKGEPYVISLEGFIYPLFYNVSHFEKAGITKVPDTWSEFKDAASKLSTISSNSQPLAVGLSMQKPSNVQNDVFAWFWAQDGTAIPTINTPENIEVMKYWASLYKAGYMNPGALVAAEQDKIELFTNERVSMMVDSLAHLNMLKERNPDLKFDIAPVPVKDGYTGRRAMLGSAWGLGISKYTKHPQESWEFVKFLLSADIDGRIADNCNAFPINKDATVSWVNSNELNKKAFTLYQKMGMKNESYGAPEANRLYLIFDEQFQLALNGDQTMEEAAAKIQSGWDEVYQKAESGK